MLWNINVWSALLSNFLARTRILVCILINWLQNAMWNVKRVSCKRTSLLFFPSCCHYQHSVTYYPNTFQPVNQPVNQASNQAANQPANQPTNQPANQPTLIRNIHCIPCFQKIEAGNHVPQLVVKKVVEKVDFVSRMAAVVDVWLKIAQKLPNRIIFALPVVEANAVMSNTVINKLDDKDFV